ncbi:hypothetical protein ACIBL6_03990 [Streptomyces sp. NPDC050400]|uniref:SCO2400 family protein n=1 Tax=Streptomyces sp. NPDC050400 TaxID=3365610 RepID=UPI0037BC60EE
MDYCHPCRRHLNGALACPGCGTPADAVRAYAEALAAQEAAEETETAEREEPLRPRGRSRRRVRAAHRRRRGRILFASAGLVLAAGGLGLAELATESSGGTEGQAAPAMSDVGTDAEEESPASADPDPAAPTAPPSSSAVSAPPSASPSPTREAPSTSPGTKQRDTPVNSTSAAASSPPDSPTTARPTTAAPRPTATKPTAQPSPSETCERFLWWCT